MILNKNNSKKEQFERINNKTRTYYASVWEDKKFENQLKLLCKRLWRDGHVSDLHMKIFTEFKKDETLYRADPCYSTKKSVA